MAKQDPQKRPSQQRDSETGDDEMVRGVEDPGASADDTDDEFDDAEDLDDEEEDEEGSF